MRPNTIATILTLALLGTACGGGENEPPTSPTAEPVVAGTDRGNDRETQARHEQAPAEETDSRENLSPPADSGVEVVTDIAYYGAGTDGVRHLDVYHPSEGSNLPLVVLFHTNPVFGGTKRNAESLATVLAERGAVVVTPTWGDRTFEPTDLLSWFRDHGTCAVWNAVMLAPAYRADPTRIVLVGEQAGILPAQMAMFSPPSRIDSCEAPATEVSIATAVLFETDWLFVPDLWDDTFASDPAYFEAITHWDDLADPVPTRIHMLAGEIEDSGTTRSMEGHSYVDSDWIGLRDPDRLLAEAFATSGLLDDDVMSFKDVMQITVGVLVAAGWNADFGIVPGVGHTLSSGGSRELVADLVFATVTG